MLDKLKDKYVFFDLDGTLSEYRFNDHVSGGNEWGGQTFEELFFGDVPLLDGGRICLIVQKNAYYRAVPQRADVRAL